MSESKVNSLMISIIGDITAIVPSIIGVLAFFKLTGIVAGATVGMNITIVVLGAIGSIASIWYNIAAGTKVEQITGKIADIITIVVPTLIAVFGFLDLVGAIDVTNQIAGIVDLLLSVGTYIATYLYDKYAK